MSEPDFADEERGELEEIGVLQEDSPNEDETFESIVREFEKDPEGKPFSDSVADAVNKIWKKPRDSEGYKNAAKRANPVNCYAYKVTVDEELYDIMSAGAKTGCILYRPCYVGQRCQQRDC